MQFFGDPEVKESIISHMLAAKRSQAYKFDKVVAESNLYKEDWGEETEGMKHHISAINMRGNSTQKYQFSEQDHLYEEFD